MNHENAKGVLAVRAGEYRNYLNAEESPEPLEGDYVYAVCLAPVLMFPGPRGEECKAESLSVIAAARSLDGTWGWTNLEKDTKQMIGEDLQDLMKAEPGVWYWLKLTIKIKEGDEEESEVKGHPIGCMCDLCFACRTSKIPHEKCDNCKRIFDPKKEGAAFNEEGFYCISCGVTLGIATEE